MFDSETQERNYLVPSAIITLFHLDVCELYIFPVAFTFPITDIFRSEKFSYRLP
jgi:hypothetical protein